MQHRNPILGYSKAPWGLSVLSRVTGIFTGTTISPGGLLRQCPNHYAFHAGQNLPDKEFRYLRDRYSYGRRSLGLRFNACTSPLNLPAPGRRQLVYVIFRFSTNLCFGKQLLGPILCGSISGAPFSRSYGVNLPSSLTTLLPLALESSSYLPVSVCGTGTSEIHTAFLAIFHLRLRY